VLAQLVTISDRALTTIASLNIRHGGGARQRALVHWLIDRSADVFVLTEWRASSASVGEELARAGYKRSEIFRDGKLANGVALFSRAAHTAVRATPPDALRGELLMVHTRGLCVLGAYFPQNQAKAAYFKRCAELVAREAGPMILIGDLNTGCNVRDIEPGGTRFHCERDFIDLTSVHGLTDLWRARHGAEAREWTWRSSKNGFRIDHAFGNQALLRAFPDFRCEIDHSPRESGISDHSALIVEL
jgi:exodeoxyribonuclease III